MEEQVFARAHVDESKALVRQTLNRTFSHRHTIGLSWSCRTRNTPAPCRTWFVSSASASTKQVRSGPFIRPQARSAHEERTLPDGIPQWGPAGMRAGT
jgi:hypothetical protein